MHRSEEKKIPHESSLAYHLGMAFAHSLDATLGLFFTSSTEQQSLTSTPNEEETNRALELAPLFFIELTKRLDDIFPRFLNSEFITLDEFKTRQVNYFIHQLNKTSSTHIVEKPNYEGAFETVLINYLQEKSFVQASSHTTGTKENTLTASKINTSLAYQWKQCDKKTNSSSLQIFFNEMSDAHGLIQVTGWSTQNENSLLAIFDYHNYIRYKTNISEARSIVLSLIAPLYPLFTEYQDIAHREKNIFLKVIRTALPMLITAGFIISMTALIPVALPELAFVILAIPLIYLGLALTSLYVKTKEHMYQNYRHFMYQDDLDKFPEFLLNHRLKTLFGDMAEKIRDDYIQAIQACDKLENKYSKQELFTPEDEKNREANLDERNTRILEWFDLRNNTKLNLNQLYRMALERPNKKFKIAHAQDKLEIKQLAHAMAKDLDTALRTDETQNTHVATHTTPKLRFFPSCLKQRSEIIQLQTLEEQISANLQI